MLTEGKGLASVGCLMHVDVMQYENGRTDRFITFNRAIDRFRLVRLVRPSCGVPIFKAFYLFWATTPHLSAVDM